MKELVITETIEFKEFSGNDSYTFPNIQGYLDDGYTVKHIFYTPLAASSVYGIAITVHLQKPE